MMGRIDNKLLEEGGSMMVCVQLHVMCSILSEYITIKNFPRLHAGIVDDDKHALSCLGGINTISKVIDTHTFVHGLQLVISTVDLCKISYNCVTPKESTEVKPNP